MRFLVRRLGFLLVALWAALTVNFFIPRLMPGNPAEAMMARFRGHVNPDALHALDVIIRRHPALVTIERTFAATPRGAALIERDLLNEKIAILEANRPLARRRLKP